MEVSRDVLCLHVCTVCGGYFADVVWSHVGCLAELAAHLQVTDAANGVPELSQAVGAGHQQRHVGPDVVELGNIHKEHSGTMKTKRRRHFDKKTAHFLTNSRVVDVDG